MGIKETLTEIFNAVEENKKGKIKEIEMLANIQKCVEQYAKDQKIEVLKGLKLSNMNIILIKDNTPKESLKYVIQELQNYENKINNKIAELKESKK